MLVKEHQFKFYIHGRIQSIRVEEYISLGRKWPEKFRASVPTSTFESKAFYASTSEMAAEQAAKYLRRTNVHQIDQVSLYQNQLKATHGHSGRVTK